MTNKGISSYRPHFTPESVASTLYIILKERVDKKEIPKKVAEDLDEFKKSEYWQSNTKDLDNIWCKVVLRILNKDKIVPRSLEQYSSLIYRWFGHKKYDAIKSHYGEIVKRSAATGNDVIVESIKCNDCPKIQNKTSTYAVLFTPESIAQAIYDTLQEKACNSENVHSNFGSFEKSNVWRSYEKPDNFWYRVVLTVVHKNKISPSVLQKYAKRMYATIANKSIAYRNIKKCFSKLVNGDSNIDEDAEKIEEFTVENSSTEKDFNVDKISKKVSQLKLENSSSSEKKGNESDFRGEDINVFEVNDYPTGFPEISKTIAGILISSKSFQTLNFNEQLDDSIINGFLLSITEKARTKGRNVILFETFVTTSIIELAYISRGFNRTISKTDLWDARVWLLPLHSKVEEIHHWSLFLIIPEDNLIIYICSLRKDPLKKWCDNICSFMETHSSQAIEWEKWVLLTPKDIPAQFGVKGSANNCGVHICTWSYILCTGDSNKFSEENMNNIRMGIAHTLMNTRLTEKAKHEIVAARQVIMDDTRVELKRTSSKEIKWSQNLEILRENSTFGHLSSLWQERKNERQVLMRSEAKVNEADNKANVQSSKVEKNRVREYLPRKAKAKTEANREGQSSTKNKSQNTFVSSSKSNELRKMSTKSSQIDKDQKHAKVITKSDSKSDKVSIKSTELPNISTKSSQKDKEQTCPEIHPNTDSKSDEDDDDVFTAPAVPPALHTSPTDSKPKFDFRAMLVEFEALLEKRTASTTKQHQSEPRTYLQSDSSVGSTSTDKIEVGWDYTAPLKAPPQIPTNYPRTRSSKRTNHS